jgi:hypothetical protein
MWVFAQRGDEKASALSLHDADGTVTVDHGRETTIDS